MAQVGQFSLALAFIVALYSIVASLIGIQTRNDKLIASGRNAAIANCFAVSAAIFTLAYLFITNDFTVAYVAAHSSIDLPLHFKISSVWGGQEGSLLFWGWLLTVYSALCVFQNRNKHRSMMPYVTAVLMGTSLFFTAMHLFVVNPFKLGGVQLAGRRAPPVSSGGWRRPESAVAGHVDGDPSAYALYGAGRFRHPLCFLHCGIDHQATRRYLDPHHPAMDDDRLGNSSPSASCWAANGPITNWDGADSGPGIRWKMRH